MRIKFTPNYPKIVEVVLWVLNECPGIHLYNLMKVLFHADYLSVNQYGAPVTSDSYIAMRFGTVPEIIYKGLISREALYIEAFQMDEQPIEIKQSYSIFSTRKANENYLSESNKECLSEGIKEYAYLSFEEVKNKNHANQAWKITYDNAPNSVIDWYDIIEEEFIREDLLGISEYVVL